MIALQSLAVASIRKEIHIAAPPEQVWDALRDVGALHTRLAPGFVTDTRVDGRTRSVTFGNGIVVREEIVSVDESRRRVAWAVVETPFHHFSGAAWVEPDISGGAHFVWTADLLPDELAGQVDQMMSQGIEVIRDALEREARDRH